MMYWVTNLTHSATIISYITVNKLSILSFIYTNTPCSKMMDGLLSSWYCFTNESGCVILSYNERKTVKVFISWTQQFSSHYCVTALNLKIATPVHKSFCVLQFEKFGSTVTVQWAFRGRFGMDCMPGYAAELSFPSTKQVRTSRLHLATRRYSSSFSL